MFDNRRCILMADDEPRILRALRDLLTANGFHVLTAGDGEEVLEVFYANSTKIDLVLLDVMMPRKDGFAVLREIRENSRVPVVMLTARGEEYDQLSGFESGADDYIPKPFSTALLLARLEAVLRRAGKEREQVLTAGAITLSPERREVQVAGQEVELTRREFELLTYFMRNQGHAFTREQLINSVWGYDYEGDERTVDAHVKNLRLKLSGQPDCLHTVHRVGYKFEVQS